MTVIGLLTVGDLSRDAEEGDDAEGDPGGDAVHVHPEGDPRDAHDERRGLQQARGNSKDALGAHIQGTTKRLLPDLVNKR